MCRSSLDARWRSPLMTRWKSPPTCMSCQSAKIHTDRCLTAPNPCLTADEVFRPFHADPTDSTSPSVDKQRQISRTKPGGVAAVDDGDVLRRHRFSFHGVV